MVYAQGSTSDSSIFSSSGVSISPYEGAIASIDVAVNSKHSGLRDVYFDKCAPASPSPEAT